MHTNSILTTTRVENPKVITHEVSLICLPPCGQCRYDTRCMLRLMFHHAVSDLDGLPEAALSQHLSMDEVRWPEDAVRPLGHHAQ